MSGSPRTTFYEVDCEDEHTEYISDDPVQATTITGEFSNIRITNCVCNAIVDTARLGAAQTFKCLQCGARTRVTKLITKWKAVITPEGHLAVVAFENVLEECLQGSYKMALFDSSHLDHIEEFFLEHAFAITVNEKGVATKIMMA